MKIEVRVYTNDGETEDTLGFFELEEIEPLVALLKKYPSEDTEGDVRIVNAVRFDIGADPHLAVFYGPQAA